MKLIIDRIENGFAVCELPDGGFADIPLSALPDAKEGDTVNIEIIRNNETAERKKAVTDRFNRLKKR